MAFAVFGYEAMKLFEEGRKRKKAGNPESICAASIEFTPITISFCALCGLLGGTVGGLLGSGGGFILGPLLLEIGVIPQVGAYQLSFCLYRLLFRCYLVTLQIIYYLFISLPLVLYII